MQSQTAAAAAEMDEREMWRAFAGLQPQRVPVRQLLARQLTRKESRSLGFYRRVKVYKRADVQVGLLPADEVSVFSRPDARRLTGAGGQPQSWHKHPGYAAERCRQYRRVRVASCQAG